ncbi:hypothetical protein FD39_GL000337 [Lactobacillus amylolyticus DSM 11664]|nr:hypothetical protein FD39_GL000337 [Lactobacillus amylolyticus DSM 11664]
MTLILPGVRPTILYASVPTATTLLVEVFTATTEGSFKTIPLPETLISTFAVPRSIPISRATITLPSIQVTFYHKIRHLVLTVNVLSIP